VHLSNKVNVGSMVEIERDEATTGSSPVETETDVVVIGSGVSGLRAASELSRIFNLDTCEFLPLIRTRVLVNWLERGRFFGIPIFMICSRI
jgi:NADH dehydrogenase FAD-containing subunit